MTSKPNDDGIAFLECINLKLEPSEDLTGVAKYCLFLNRIDYCRIDAFY